jgi:hypothetical protein
MDTIIGFFIGTFWGQAIIDFLTSWFAGLTTGAA